MSNWKLLEAYQGSGYIPDNYLTGDMEVITGVNHIPGSQRSGSIVTRPLSLEYRLYASLAGAAVSSPPPGATWLIVGGGSGIYQEGSVDLTGQPFGTGGVLVYLYVSWGDISRPADTSEGFAPYEGPSGDIGVNVGSWVREVGAVDKFTPMAIWFPAPTSEITQSSVNSNWYLAPPLFAPEVLTSDPDQTVVETITGTGGESTDDATDGADATVFGGGGGSMQRNGGDSVGMCAGGLAGSVAYSHGDDGSVGDLPAPPIPFGSTDIDEHKRAYDDTPGIAGRQGSSNGTVIDLVQFDDGRYTYHWTVLFSRIRVEIQTQSVGDGVSPKRPAVSCAVGIVRSTEPSTVSPKRATMPATVIRKHEIEGGTIAAAQPNLAGQAARVATAAGSLVPVQPESSADAVAASAVVATIVAESPDIHATISRTVMVSGTVTPVQPESMAIASADPDLYAAAGDLVPVQPESSATVTVKPSVFGTLTPSRPELAGQAALVFSTTSDTLAIGNPTVSAVILVGIPAFGAIAPVRPTMDATVERIINVSGVMSPAGPKVWADTWIEVHAPGYQSDPWVRKPWRS